MPLRLTRGFPPRRHTRGLRRVAPSGLGQRQRAPREVGFAAQPRDDPSEDGDIDTVGARVLRHRRSIERCCRCRCGVGDLWERPGALGDGGGGIGRLDERLPCAVCCGWLRDDARAGRERRNGRLEELRRAGLGHVDRDESVCGIGTREERLAALGRATQEVGDMRRRRCRAQHAVFSGGDERLAHEREGNKEGTRVHLRELLRGNVVRGVRGKQYAHPRGEDGAARVIARHLPGAEAEVDRDVKHAVDDFDRRRGGDVHGAQLFEVREILGFLGVEGTQVAQWAADVPAAGEIIGLEGDVDERRAVGQVRNLQRSGGDDVLEDRCVFHAAVVAGQGIVLHGAPRVGKWTPPS